MNETTKAVNIDQIDVETLKIGSSEWQALNDRRADLIRRKNREGISEQEREEFERLQRIVRTVLDKQCPLPSVDTARLDQIEERLWRAQQPKAG